MGDLSESLLSALRLGLEYNPLVSVVAAPVVAALAARSPKKHSLLGWPGAVLLAAWFAGDGYCVLALAVRPGVTWVDAPSIALWGLTGFVLGYALPAWAGAFVGRRVTHGTGWLSAAAVAASAALALAAAVAALS